MRFFLIIFFLFIFLSPSFVFAETAATQVNISVNAVVEGEGYGPGPEDVRPPSGDSGWTGGTYVPPETKVIFKGKAYPEAFLTLLKDGKVAATFLADESGLFQKEINSLAGGTYTFGVWAEDADGRQSVTVSFTVGVIAKMTTTISGIFIPPTIEVKPIRAERGQAVNIFGRAFPGSEINLFISPEEMVKKINASQKGEWSYWLDTSLLEKPEYQAKARASFTDGEQSSFSQTVSFSVLKPKPEVPACRGADLNFDGTVNIIDFSILLYFWDESHPSNRCADINSDGTVNIIDFSIMMYWWNG